MNCAGKAVKLDTLNAEGPLPPVALRLFKVRPLTDGALPPAFKAPRVAVPVKPHTYGIVLSAFPVAPCFRLPEELQGSAMCGTGPSK
jgi:hypothetical protein